MILVLHIISALLSIGMATFVAISPTMRRLIANYVLVGSTVATGTYLMVAFPAHLASSCVEGLVYLGIATGLSIVAQIRLRRRLAEQDEL